MAKLLLVTPVYSAVSAGYAQSILSLDRELRSRGIELETQLLEGMSDVAVARAYLVARCLASDADRFLMVDADTTFTPEAVLKLMVRPVDFIAGAIPIRTVMWDNFAKAVRNGAPDPVSLAMPFAVGLHVDEPLEIVDGAIRCRFATVAFALLSRRLLQAMADAHPELRFTRAETGETGWALFNHLIEEGTLQGEDVSFCTRVRALGFPIWTLIDQEFTHTGSASFTGNFAAMVDYLQRGLASMKVAAE